MNGTMLFEGLREHRRCGAIRMYHKKWKNKKILVINAKERSK